MLGEGRIGIGVSAGVGEGRWGGRVNRRVGKWRRYEVLRWRGKLHRK